MNKSLPIESSEVFDHLYVGSVPPRGPHVAAAGFSHLVLCAVEHQYESREFPGVRVLHCPFMDHGDVVMNREIMSMIFLAGHAVADAVRAGGRVLVTCRAGQNRSALVAAIAMQRMGVPPRDTVVALRKRRRWNCLDTEAFERIVLRTHRLADFFWE